MNNNDKYNTKKILHGAIGVTKATLGIDKSSKDLYLQRISICKECPKVKLNDDKIICTECGCNLKLKARINKETCPWNKW